MGKNLFFIIILFFTGCYNTSDGGDNNNSKNERTANIVVKDFHFKYNQNLTKIEGYFNVTLDNVLPNNTLIQLINPLIDIKCNYNAYLFSPENLTFNTPIRQKVDLNITFDKPCKELSFRVVAQKVISNSDENNKSLNSSIQNWQREFSITIPKSPTHSKNINFTSSPFSLNSKNSINIKFLNENNSSLLIDNSKIESVKVTILNKDMLSFFSNQEFEYSYQNDNNKTIFLNSYFKSGEAYIKIEATILKDNIENLINEIYPIKILSGGISSLSIVKDSNKSQQKVGAFYQNSYQILPLDSYGNRANQGERVYIGVINGIKKDFQGKYIISTNGSLIVEDKTKLVDKNFDFRNIYPSSDRVVILATKERINPAYLGDWSISHLNQNSDLSRGVLTLKEYYNSSLKTPLNNLKFIIGNKRRYNQFSDTISIVNIDKEDGIYQVDENGSIKFKLIYEPNLFGRSVFIYAHTIPNPKITANNKRVGVAINELLGGDLSEGFLITTPQEIMNEENITISKDVFLSLKTKEGFAVKNAIVSAKNIAGECQIRGTYDNSSSKTDREGEAKFVVTLPPLKSCSLKISTIFRDDEKNNFE